MFYHVEPSVIPDSRFKRIVNVTQKELTILTVFVIFWIFSALTIFKFNYLDKLNPTSWNTNSKFDFIALFSSSIFFCGVAFFIRSVYKLLSNSKISKLTIKGELELGEAVDKSVFNQHLEEILYFFERTDFNVVTIEDVDRFDSTDIFTKLREINILINNSNLIKRPIKFIYAIKDEMFRDKNERVKFFEFIIPIIPFINQSNANEQISKLITSANLQDELSTDFTSDVVTFIDDIDIRLLINIFQEYQIYRSILGNSLKQDNLFAILVYKNVYPNDFGNLAKRKGLLYKFLTNKKEYLKSLKSKYDLEIERIESQIVLIEKESISDIKELRAIYINKLVSKLSNFYSFYTNKEVSLVEALEDEFFNRLKETTDINYRRFELYYSNQYTISGIITSGISIKDLQKEVSLSLTYEQREMILHDKTKNHIDTLKSEKLKLQSKISELESLSIQDIFRTVDISEHLGDFKDSYLIRSLLLNGYIDEHFEDYISLFHEINLTQNDFSFERNVKAGILLNFDYKLTKIENLIKRVPEKYFKNEAILNFSLLNFLLNNKNKYRTQLNLFYKGLSIDNEKQFRFILEFLKTEPNNIQSFIKDLCIQKVGLWNYINHKSGLPDQEVRNIIKFIFEYSDSDTILKFEDVQSLVKYFEELPDFFEFSSSFGNTANIQKFISNKKLLFKNLDMPKESQKEIFYLIYSKNHYRINQQNILSIIEGNRKQLDMQLFNKANYTTILSLGLPYLNNFLESEIETYVINVMLQNTENTDEAEATILNVINNENISSELKERILTSQNNSILSIADIDSIEVKKTALLVNKISPTWENIFSYYDSTEEDEFDHNLIKFLNDNVNYLPLSLEKLNENTNKDEEYIKKISRKLLHCQDLELEPYTAILNSLPYIYNKVTYEELTILQLSKLLDKNILTLSSENFTGLKNKDRNLSTRLIENHQNQFLKDFSNFTLDVDDWIKLFQSSIVTTETKLSLIQVIDDSIIIDSSTLSNTICFILPARTYIPLRFEVLQSLFKNYSSVQKRLELLDLHFSNLDESQIQTLIEIWGSDYVRIFTKKNKPVFPNNQLHRDVFNKLQERNMIIRYETEDDNKIIRVYAKYQ